MSTELRLCAPGPQEFSLCGMAFDAFESGDAEAPIVFAADRKRVTCEHCIAVIGYTRSHFSSTTRAGVASYFYRANP